MRNFQLSNLSLTDAIVKNDEAVPKESLSFEIRSDACCLQIQDKWDCNVRTVAKPLDKIIIYIKFKVQGMNAAKVFNLEPGKEMIVSLVWPTLVLYNRVGNCSVVVETFRAKGNTIDDSRLVSFNTTIVSESIHDYLFCKLKYLTILNSLLNKNYSRLLQ